MVHTNCIIMFVVKPSVATGEVLYSINHASQGFDFNLILCAGQYSWPFKPGHGHQSAVVAISTTNFKTFKGGSSMQQATIRPTS